MSGKSLAYAIPTVWFYVQISMYCYFKFSPTFINNFQKFHVTGSTNTCRMSLKLLVSCISFHWDVIELLQIFGLVFIYLKQTKSQFQTFGSILSCPSIVWYVIDMYRYTMISQLNFKCVRGNGSCVSLEKIVAKIIARSNMT